MTRLNRIHEPHEVLSETLRGWCLHQDFFDAGLSRFEAVAPPTASFASLLDWRKPTSRPGFLPRRAGRALTFGSSGADRLPVLNRLASGLPESDSLNVVLRGKFVEPAKERDVADQQAGDKWHHRQNQVDGNELGTGFGFHPPQLGINATPVPVGPQLEEL